MHDVFSSRCLFAHEESEKLVERYFAVTALIEFLEKLLQVRVADVILETGLKQTATFLE